MPTTPLTRGIKHAQRARKNKILVDNSKRVGTYTPGGGNSRKCQDGTSCVPSDNPEHWCNITEEGVCSAMSD